MTFFEMMGNWLSWRYFKKEAIELLTSQKWLGLDPKTIYATVFAGDENSPRDDESIDYWKRQFATGGNLRLGFVELGQEAQKNSRIFLMGAEDNWWGQLEKPVLADQILKCSMIQVRERLFEGYI